MNEATEQRVTEAPECWEHKSEYWSCTGASRLKDTRTLWQKLIGAKIQRPPTWTCLYYSKEDAEAYAASIDGPWQWDKHPAITVTLSYAMSESRRKGDLGVIVLTFSGGKWVTVRTYKASEPLPEDLR